MTDFIRWVTAPARRLIDGIKDRATVVGFLAWTAGDLSLLFDGSSFPAWYLVCSGAILVLIGYFDPPPIKEERDLLLRYAKAQAESSRLVPVYSGLIRETRADTLRKIRELVDELEERGSLRFQVNGEWWEIRSTLDTGDQPAVTLSSLNRLLQADWS